MSRLKALFTKGFMKLTKGRQLMLVAPDELVVTETSFKEFVIDFATHHTNPLEQRIRELEEMREEMRENAYQYGLEAGMRKSSDYTLLLPSAIREENKHLVEIVGLIASELLEQGDIKSCTWLLKKIADCRSL